MCRADITVLCAACLIVGFLSGATLRPNDLGLKLDTLNANVATLDQSLTNGLIVKADVDVLGIGARHIALYQNQGNDWVIGSKDAFSSAMDPVLLFNNDLNAPDDTTPTPNVSDIIKRVSSPNAQ